MSRLSVLKAGLVGGGGFGDTGHEIDNKKDVDQGTPHCKARQVDPCGGVGGETMF